MANDLVKIVGGELTNFDPAKTKRKLATLNGIVSIAKEMKDWELGKEAVAWIVKEQGDFVIYWKDRVAPAGNPKAKKLQNGNFSSVEELVRETGIRGDQVTRWSKELARPGYDARLFRHSHKKAMADGAQSRADLQTGEMEWFTPAEYIERARQTLGEIDLDPASCDLAQQIIEAKKYHTLEDDGLKQKWKGRVWLNPPYAGPLIAAFSDKMLESIKSGDVPAAVMLTNAYTETSWFHGLANAAAALCFTRGRIKFESPHGEKCSPTNGQVFFYFGDNPTAFWENFYDVGFVVRAWN